MRHLPHIFLIAISLVFCGAFPLFAAELQSTSFIIRDPIMSGGGTYADSASFGLFTSTDLVFTGTSSGVTGSQKYGFIPFPTVTTPVLTAMLIGDDTASVSWTEAEAYLGWTVGGYRYAISTGDEDGPYAYSSVGFDLAATSTPLLPDTTYYFTVVVEDALGNAIGTSTPVSLTTPENGTSGGGGGGGGGGTQTPGGTQSSGVNFYGYAHPHGTVYILRDGIIVDEIPVGPDGRFDASFEDVVVGSYLFTIYGVDANGIRSGFLSLPVTLTQTTAFSSTRIFIPPTLSFDTTAAAGTFRVYGETIPNASVAIAVTDGPATLSLQAVTSDEQGRYSFSFPSPELFGEGFAVRTLAALGSVRSPFGTAIHLAAPTPRIRGDFSSDAKVNLVDFSILAYWQGREGVPAKYDLNGDGEITLADFSILTYYWTG